MASLIAGRDVNVMRAKLHLNPLLQSGVIRPYQSNVALLRSPHSLWPQADFLFVQNAKSMSFDSATNKLTPQNVSPVTVFFSDRPERIAGNMKTAAFVPHWSTGKDSFLSDPPNADIHY